MSQKRPLMISGDGYVLLDRQELSRLLAIESRARHKLTQLRADRGETGQERRLAHIEALEFTLGTAFGLEAVESVTARQKVSEPSPGAENGSEGAGNSMEQGSKENG